jgi:mono/diheme cytochrome c family protein
MILSCLAVLAVLLATVWPLGLPRHLAAEEVKPAATDAAATEKQARGLTLFKDSIRPTLVKQCGKCHLGDDVEGEFDLATRESLLLGGTSKAAIIPGNAKESLLFKLINHEKKPVMPAEADKLPADVIAKIGEWIDLGAPYDEPLYKKVGPPAWTVKVVAPETRQHWAYQKLGQFTPPTVQDSGWSHNGVDNFIWQAQHAASIQPNAPADKRKLIRRAYFDLIGLPPSPQEVDEFLKDTSPQAFERVVDRLLESKHYGEKWARHWLDLARFAESHGFEHDYDRPTAYHYRDFVIQALNQNLPYDQFVKWQLAGDELAPDNNLALMATGYLAAGVHSTQITANEVEKHRYDEMDDILATTGTAMLGLTFGCARCHDHKFDAIPQADYYRMLSTFTTTVRTEVDLDMDPAWFQSAKAEFAKQHVPLEAELKKFEEEQLPGRLAKWEAEGALLANAAQWLVLDQVEAKSAGGATFKKLDDGSFLATEKKPDNDTYTFVMTTNLQELTTLRLEALTDPSMVKGGPGRAENGNFALTEIVVHVAPKSDPAKPVRVKLLNPRATFEQKGLPISAAVDDNPGSGWAVDPEFGKNHAAAFDFEKPIGSAEGVILTVTMEFKNNVRHAIGRPRLSVTQAKQPVDLVAPSLAASVVGVLKTPIAERKPEQTAALLNWYKALDAEWQPLNKKVQDHLATAPKPKLSKALISSEGLPAVRLHTQGGDFLPATHFLRRGDPNLKDGEATAAYLQVLMRTPTPGQRWPVQPPQGARTSYRRTAFANWMTDLDEGAGALLARVAVNRMWQQHLGRGIVASVSDFGIRGEKPTHPELLDWLATELIRNGWKLKPIHRLIMLSSTYQQSSHLDPAKQAPDPDNRFVWRRPKKRLEAEVLRDAILKVGGLLDESMFGPGTLDTNSNRRSIYFTVKRSKLIPMLQVFDCPDALSGIGERQATIIAPQALLLMNNPRVREASKKLARKISPAADTTLEAALNEAYSVTLSRLPTADELKTAVTFVTQQTESHKQAGHGEPQQLALADMCQILLCLNEFVYLD